MAQERLQKGPETGGQPSLYDPQTVVTVQGVVVALEPTAGKAGLPEPVHLQLKTAQGIVTVLLGPNWFLARQPLKFSPLDRLEVTGSKITLQGKPVLVAAAVKKGEQVLKLRTEQGMPLWGKQSGSGQ